MRNSVVLSVEDFPIHCVAQIFHSTKNAVENVLVRLMAQALHILNDDHSRSLAPNVLKAMKKDNATAL